MGEEENLKFIDEVAKLPGVSRKAGETLVNAGIDTMEKLRAATKEQLVEIRGIGPKTADAILEGLKAREEGEPEPEIEIREAKKTKGKDAKAAKKETDEKVEVVEPVKVYRPKIKADISPELKRALEVRAIRADQEPAFRKYHWWYAVRVKEAWRAPKGELSKQRRGFKYRPPRVKVGYGKPAMTRHLHPSGFEEVLVANPDELTLIDDPKRQAARIRGSVGARKAKLIESAAAEKGIRVLNPRRS